MKMPIVLVHKQMHTLLVLAGMGGMAESTSSRNPKHLQKAGAVASVSLPTPLPNVAATHFDAVDPEWLAELDRASSLTNW